MSGVAVTPQIRCRHSLTVTVKKERRARAASAGNIWAVCEPDAFLTKVPRCFPLWYPRLMPGHWLLSVAASMSESLGGTGCVLDCWLQVSSPYADTRLAAPDAAAMTELQTYCCQDAEPLSNFCTSVSGMLHTQHAWQSITEFNKVCVCQCCC